MATPKKVAAAVKSAWLGESGSFNAVQFTFPSSPQLSPIIVKVSDLNETIKNACLVHGLNQKLGDGAALGAGATPAQKRAAILAIAEQISGTEGTWTAARTGAVVDLVMFEAFQVWLGNNERKPFADIAAFRAWVDKMSEARKCTPAQYRASMEQKFDGLKAIVDEIRAKAVTAPVAEADLTSDLDAIGE